jgi:hypothetical protein
MFKTQFAIVYVTTCRLDTSSSVTVLHQNYSKLSSFVIQPPVFYMGLIWPTELTPVIVLKRFYEYWSDASQPLEITQWHKMMLSKIFKYQSSV